MPRWLGPWIARSVLLIQCALYMLVIWVWIASTIVQRAVSYSARSHDVAIYVQHDLFIPTWNQFSQRRIPGWEFLPGWQRNNFEFYGDKDRKGGIGWPVYFFWHANGQTSEGLDIPCWIPVVLLGIFMLDLPFEFRNARTNRRARLGHCLNCGYDLRASPEKCPECGMVPVPHTPPIALFRKHFMHRALLVAFLGTFAVALGSNAGFPHSNYRTDILQAAAIPSDPTGAMISALGPGWSVDAVQIPLPYPDGRPSGNGRAFAFCGPPISATTRWGYLPVTIPDEFAFWIMPTDYVDQPTIPSDTNYWAMLIAVTPDSKVYFSYRNPSGNWWVRTRAVLLALFPEAR